MIPKNPRLAYGFLSTSYLGRGRDREALDARLKALELGGDTERLDAYRAAYAQGGYAATARWELKKLKDRSRVGYVSPFDLAALCARSGEAEEAFQWLERAFHEHSDRLVFLHVDGAFDGIRGDRRFADLVRRVGLPPSVPAP